MTVTIASALAAVRPPAGLPGAANPATSAGAPNTGVPNSGLPGTVDLAAPFSFAEALEGLADSAGTVAQQFSGGHSTHADRRQSDAEKSPAGKDGTGNTVVAAIVPAWVVPTPVLSLPLTFATTTEAAASDAEPPAAEPQAPSAATTPVDGILGNAGTEAAPALVTTVPVLPVAGQAPSVADSSPAQAADIPGSAVNPEPAIEPARASAAPEIAFAVRITPDSDTESFASMLAHAVSATAPEESDTPAPQATPADTQSDATVASGPAAVAADFSRAPYEPAPTASPVWVPAAATVPATSTNVVTIPIQTAATVPAASRQEPSSGLADETPAASPLAPAVSDPLPAAPVQDSGVALRTPAVTPFQDAGTPQPAPVAANQPSSSASDPLPAAPVQDSGVALRTPPSSDPAPVAVFEDSATPVSEAAAAVTPVPVTAFAPRPRVPTPSGHTVDDDATTAAEPQFKANTAPAPVAVDREPIATVSGPMPAPAAANPDAGSAPGTAPETALRNLPAPASPAPQASAPLSSATTASTPSATTPTAAAPASVQAPVRKTSESEPDTSPRTSSSQTQIQFQAPAPAWEPNPRADSSRTSQPAAATEPAAIPEPQVTAQPKQAEALKDISLQIGSPTGEKVQVRLVQQTGELHVAVRTADTEVARGLQQGLPDLVSRLQENGYRAETWKPAQAATTTAAASAETRNPSGHSHTSDSGTSSGWSQQQSGQRNRNQSNQPRWLQDLESSMNGGTQS